MTHLDLTKITVLDNYTCAFTGKIHPFSMGYNEIWSVADEKRLQQDLLRIDAKNAEEEQ